MELLRRLASPPLLVAALLASGCGIGAAPPLQRGDDDSVCVCPSPPPSDWKSACDKGATFLAYLPGPCGGCTAVNRTCLYEPITVKCPPKGAVLPQDEAYQIVLRHWMATLTQKDLDVPPLPLVWDDQLATSPDELYRAWIAARSIPVGVVATSGLLVPWPQFQLGFIEQGGVKMAANHPLPISPSLFWTLWKHPGNPYFESAALRRRAFVAAAVDMMMLDRAHEKGAGAGNLYLSGTMVWYGAVHDVVRSEVPICVRGAYEAGLRRMFEKLEKWDGNNGNNDMGMPAHVAMFYAARGSGDPALMARAVAESKEELAAHYHPAGYLDHGANGQGFDGSYEGISLYFLSWGALATIDHPDYGFLRDTLGQFSRLKAYLTLPEPGNTRYVSPTHFSNATAGGSANDQWEWEHRDYAAAMVSDEAKYLAVGGRSGRSIPVPDEATMKRDLAAAFASWSKSLTGPRTPVSVVDWGETHWSTGFNYAAVHYRPGFHDTMRGLAETKSPLLLAPWLRPGDFIERFDRDFVVARFGSGPAAWGAIIHTGRLATGWPTVTLPFGFGGGALSAFWTPDAGPALLGLQPGSQSPHPNQWSEWRTWPTHAVSGESAAGKPFSSARLLNPTVEVTPAQGAPGQNMIDIQVKGQLGSSIDSATTAPDGALAGIVDFQRRFHLDASGVQVETRVAPAGTPDSIRDLWETLPTYHDGEQASPVTLIVAGARMAARTQVIRGVQSIEVARKGGAVVIDFETPQGVKLAPWEWSVDYQVKQRARTLLIDLLQSGGAAAPFPARTLRYRIHRR